MITDDESTLTAQEARDFLSYDPLTGLLTWKKRGIEMFRSQRSCSTWNARFAGAIAGSVNSFGYIKLRLNGINYSAHRIIWLIQIGNWPLSGFDIDHINRNKSDNRWSNLRVASRSQNQANQCARRNGLKGAHYNKRLGKWCSVIGSGGRKVHLGTFATEIEAHNAYVLAASKIYGEYARAA